MVDSSQPSGVKWGTISSSGGGVLTKGKVFLYIGLSLLLVLFLSFVFGTIRAKYEVVKIRQELLKQMQEEKNRYEKQLQEYQIRIEDLQKQLELSEKRTIAYRKQFQALERKKQEIKKPETEREIYERFKKLGYNPSR